MIGSVNINLVLVKKLTLPGDGNTDACVTESCKASIKIFDARVSIAFLPFRNLQPELVEQISVLEAIAGSGKKLTV